MAVVCDYLRACGGLQWVTIFEIFLSPFLYQSCFLIMEDGDKVRLQNALAMASVDHHVWAINIYHRQLPFLAASQSAASRLTLFLVVGLRRDIITHCPDNVRFCSLDSVRCRSHSSLAVMLLLKVVSTHQPILLSPFCRSFAATIFLVFMSVSFRRFSAATM